MPSPPRVSFEDLKTAFPLVDVAGRYTVLKRASGREYKGICPFHAERSPSFYVYKVDQGPHQQRFHCFGCGKQGDVLDFLCAAEGREVGDVARDLAARAGLASGPTPEARRRLDTLRREAEAAAPPEADFEIVLPVPDYALALARQGDTRTGDIMRPKADAGDKARLRLSIDRLHRVRDYDNRDLGYVVRTPPNVQGKKATPQVVWARNVRLSDGTVGEGWTFAAFPVPRLPYGAHLIGAGLREGKPRRYLVVEGEKCQETGARILEGCDLIPVSWIGGGRAWDRTDWREVAEGEVWLWPDNDPQGDQTMREIGAALSQFGCQRMFMVPNPPGREKGWDIDDAVTKEGWDATRILEHVLASPSWSPDQHGPDTPNGGGGGEADPLGLEERIERLIEQVSMSPRAAFSREAIEILAEAHARDFGLWAETKARLKAAGAKEIRELEKKVLAVSKRFQAEGKFESGIQDGSSEATSDIEAQDSEIRALGYDKGTYYYYSPVTRQVVEIRAKDHKSAPIMFQLAPRQWWAARYGSGDGGVNWESAANAMMQACHDMSVYNPDMVRGRGAWFDGDHIVVHLGESLIVDGRREPLQAYRGPFVYERSQSIIPPAATPLTDDEAQALEQICSHVRWREDDDLSAMLLAGWIVLAPVCGALRWRSHIWITGGAGSGKSWLMSNVLTPLVGHIAVQCQSSTTEAGIRHALSSDARPILFDEAENEDEAAQRRIRQILELMRQASSENGAPILKGTSDQMGRRYTIRSMFALSSIVVAAKQQADIGRISTLEVADAPPPGSPMKDRDEARWRTMKSLVEQYVTPDFASRLFSRTLQQLHVIRANIETCTAAVARVTGSQRTGDQVGTLLAGAVSLSSRDPISREEAADLVGSIRALAHTGVATDDRDEWRLWSHLIAHRVRVETPDSSPFQRSLGELMQIAAGFSRENGPLSRDRATKVLSESGVKVVRDQICISNNHRDIEEALRGTPWQTGWHKLLARLPGSHPTPNSIYFSAGHNQRAVVLPAALVAPAGPEPRLLAA